ncbi:methyltransferase TYW3-domain-containing protein [Paraphysoderma sedebokerense]|nr:methyltransferase TYW3-domain-containing protein [Paraphysoderma sedebokerense]
MSFDLRKSQILASLASSLPDKSPKGYIDGPIVKIADLINSHQDFVTTSSCSGRVCVYSDSVIFDQEVQSQEDIAGEQESNPSIAGTKKKKKKGGQWLFVSHYPLEFPDIAASPVRSPVKQNDQHGATNNQLLREYITKLLKVPPKEERNWRILFPGNMRDDEKWGKMLPTDSKHDVVGKIDADQESLIYLKFEPLILHVLCRDLVSSTHLLSVATQSGCRNCGITLPSLVAPYTPDILPNVAIRSTAKLDCPVALVRKIRDGEGSTCQNEIVFLMEPFAIYRLLLECNIKFQMNQDRLDKLDEAISKWLTSQSVSPVTPCSSPNRNVEANTNEILQEMANGPAESKAERRERKKREGLERQKALRAERGPDESNEQAKSVEDHFESLNLVL